MATRNNALLILFMQENHDNLLFQKLCATFFNILVKLSNIELMIDVFFLFSHKHFNFRVSHFSVLKPWQIDIFLLCLNSLSGYTDIFPYRSNYYLLNLRSSMSKICHKTQGCNTIHLYLQNKLVSFLLELKIA